MSQNSILELLSVTSNAVKALDRTTSSRSSGSGGGSPRTGRTVSVHNNVEPPLISRHGVLDNSRSSADSGVGKTVTQSRHATDARDAPATEQLQDSDASTTASDGFVSSAHDKGKTFKSQAVVLDASVSSQGSKYKELDNFNVSDAKKVKVSKKHLKEIVSPRDSVESNHQIGLVGDRGDTNVNFNNDNQKFMHQPSHVDFKPETGKVINGMASGKVTFNQKTTETESERSRSASQKKFLRQGVDSECTAYTVERHDHRKDTFAAKDGEKSTDRITEFRRSQTSQQISQFPYTVSKHDNVGKKQVLVEPEDVAEDWDEQSLSSSQPEIVTVPERVVNISSQAMLLSDYEDCSSQGSVVDAVFTANRPHKPQSFPNPKPKPQGVGLKQGALMQGPGLSKPDKGDEVHISRFALTDKQREVRDALSKRGSQSKPVKRVVQPKMVPSTASSVSDDGLNKNNNMDSEAGGGGGGGGGGNVEAITAAVAASAAVAATQPFLKMQQEMENKMQSLLAEMERVQKQVSTTTTTTSTGEGSGQPVVSPRMQQLEKQVKELTEHRLQHLETLQSQQMQLQAHLLSMSRDMSQQQRQQSSHPVYFPTSLAQPPAPSKPSYNRALIERELMRGRLQDLDKERGGGELTKSVEVPESALDTPNPRSRPPRPAQFDGGKGGLLQEILAAEPSPQLNTTFSLAQSHAGRSARGRHADGGSPVEKARKLVHDLSNLEDQTAESIWTETSHRNKMKLGAEEPAPLEYYLKRVRDANSTPYSKLGRSHHRSRSSSPSKSTPGATKPVYTAQGPVPDKYGEARSVLHSVTSERETLEKNLELMLRSRQDVDVYALLGANVADSSEMTRIQRMVQKRISSLKEEVKREVAWDLQHNVVPTKSASFQDVRKPGRGPAAKPNVGFGSGAPRMSRLDTGLHKSRSEPNTLAMPGRGKKVIKTRPPPKKSKIPEDEDTQTHIYGKAQYQKGRTTVKDPYLHFQNQAKHRPTRLPSPKRVEDVINVKSCRIQTEASSALHRGAARADQSEGGPPRQFYFSPTRGYVPLTAASAPVGGQLVPMAIPLGKPRMDAGLAAAREDRAQSVSVQPLSGARPVVTAATNVALVAINTDPDAPPQDRGPELSKQVLPGVDINSVTPASSTATDDEMKESDAVRNAGYLETYHYQESEEEDEERDKTLTEDASDEEEQQGTGFSLPGYHQPTPARDTASLLIHDRASKTSQPPDRPSQLREQGEVAWEERSDELAEDLRMRDVLHNKTRYWLEQELMARMLMKLYPVMSAQAEAQAGHLVEQDDIADGTDSIPDDESLMVGDTIGQRGLQLFVDTGQPVNNTLVNALVREVIAEKVGGMLGRRQERDSADPGTYATRSQQAKQAAGKHVDDDYSTEETEFVRPSRQTDRVPTPQPTPPSTSPVPGYVSHAPATPPLTPPPPPIPPRDKSPVKDVSSESSAPAPAMVSAATSITPQAEPAPQPVYESETEVSASLDISEELRVLDTKLKEVQGLPAVARSLHEVPTPSTTPPPTPPPTQPTPATPPDSPPLRAVFPPEVAIVAQVDKAPQQAAVVKEPESRSPQPWGNPDSPGPELNPNFEEPSDMGHAQPKPLMMSKAVGTEIPTVQRRTPSPPQRRRSVDQSELDSVSSPSSATDTLNDNVSEGQWLISRSEGQAAGLPLDDDIHRRAVEAARRIDTSTASTLRDTEDLDLDDTDVSRSEGEFLHKGDVLNPETDPVLALLMQMQHQPGGFRQYDIPANRVQHVLSNTERSVGEVSRNGQQGYGGMRKSVGEMSEGQLMPGGQVTVVTPKMASPPPPQDDDRFRHRGQGDRMTGSRGRSASPSVHQAANGQRSRTPQGPNGRQRQYQPVSSGLPPSHSRRPLKSALVRNSDDSRHSRDSDPDFDRRGPPTEYGTRTLTPDQLNTEALLQSGTYMSRSMGSSGRQGSTKKSVEFDLSGTYQMSRRSSSNRSDDGFTSTGGSSGRLASSGRSLGLKYSFEDSESDREVRSSGLRMSVTIPTTEAGSESEVSEIDLSDTGP